MITVGETNLDFFTCQKCVVSLGLKEKGRELQQISNSQCAVSLDGYLHI